MVPAHLNPSCYFPNTLRSVFQETGALLCATKDHKGVGEHSEIKLSFLGHPCGMLGKKEPPEGAVQTAKEMDSHHILKSTGRSSAKRYSSSKGLFQNHTCFINFCGHAPSVLIRMSLLLSPLE